MTCASFDPMLARFLLELEGQGRSQRTLALYRYIIERFQGSGTADPVVYLASLDGAMQLVTRRYHGRILRFYFGWCIKHGRKGPNPLAGLRFSEPPLPPRRPYTQEDVVHLLAACRTPRERAILLLLHSTGMRASEVAGVCSEDVAGDVLILLGKGSKRRSVALSAEVLKAMRLCFNGSGPVFPGLNRGNLCDILRRLGRRAGVEHVHAHRFRYTLAHRFLEAGGDIGNLRLILGHATFAMTARYAAYFESERAVIAHRRFLADGVIGGVGGGGPQGLQAQVPPPPESDGDMWRYAT